MIQDQNIDWVRAKHYYNSLDLNGLIIAAINEGGVNNFAAGLAFQNARLQGAATITAPNVSLGKVSTFGLVGLAFAAAGTDVLDGYIDLPYNLDPKYPVYFKGHWTTTAASGTATWALNVKPIKTGAALVTGPVSGALDTVWGASTSTIANGNFWTARGIKKALGVTRQDVEDGATLQISIGLTAVSGATTAANSIFLGLEMSFVPQFTIGNGCHTDKPYFSHGRT